MAIALRNATPEVYHSKADSISVLIYGDGVAATPTVCTATIYDSGNNVKRTPDVTITAGKLAIATEATDFTAAERGCRVEWSATVSGVVAEEPGI